MCHPGLKDVSHQDSISQSRYKEYTFFVSDYFLFSSVKDITWQNIYVNSTQYIIGGMLLAIIAGLFTFVTFYLLFSVVKMVRNKRAN